MKRYHRKLQKISESYFVSLPKNWIKNYKLNKNSSVIIDIRSDGALLINPKMRENTLDEEITLPATRSVARAIVKNSLSGIERINVVSEKPIDKEIMRDIRAFIDGLPNTDIIDESPQRIVIQNFGYKKVPTRKLIQRLLYLGSEMFENVRENQKSDLNRNFKQLRKFYFILVTHVRTYLRTGIYISEDNDFTAVEAMDFRMFCQKIEQIGEILRNFTYSPIIGDYFEKIERYYDELVDSFLKRDLEFAYDLWFKRDNIVDAAKTLMKGLEHDEVDRLKDLVMIAHACKDMAALI